jgi:hypothetical protein
VKLSADEKAVRIDRGVRAPFSGYLLPQKDFNDATISFLELKACEGRLEKIDCQDSPEDQWRTVGDGVLAGFIGFALGGLLVMYLR